MQKQQHRFFIVTFSIKYQSYFLIQKMPKLLKKYAKGFEREIQPHEMVKSLCESAEVL